MHLVRHIVERTTRPFLGSLLGLALLVLATPTPASAAPMAKLMGMPAFTNLVMAIARVNKAMRSAAENPMDDFRRKNARAAVAALPAAIAGLAAEFQAGKLHNADLPQVQALLGGFIDVNAADNYKKFLQHPSAALIPQVGAGLPAHMMNVGPEPSNAAISNRLGFDESRARGAGQNYASVGKDPNAQQVEPAPGLLGGRSPASLPPEKISSSASGNEERRLGFDDSRPEVSAPEAPTGPSTAVGVMRDNSGIAPAIGSGRSAMVDATRDLIAVENQAKRDGLEPITDKSDDGVLMTKKRTEKPAPGKYRITPRPKNWKFGMLLHRAESLLIHDAHAEGGGGECKDCGGGGGGGGGGGDAAGILMGVAAIIAAIAPMVVAGIQADADKEIAKQQAEAQKWMTNRTAENSEKLAVLQQQTALTQAGIAAQVAKDNSQGVTDRLNMQLAELRNAREDAAAAERERIALEEKYNERRIALAEKQAEQNLELAQATLNAQLTQAGLTGGSGQGAVGVTPTTTTATNAQSIASAQASQSQQSAGLGARSNSVASLQPISSGRTTGARALTSDEQASGTAPSGGQRLLASVIPASSTERGITSVPGTRVAVNGVQSSAEEEQETEIDPRKPAKKTTAARGLKAPVRVATVAAAVAPKKAQVATVDSRLLTALRSSRGLVGGSAKIIAPVSAPVRGIASTASSDIGSFIPKSNSDKDSFAAYSRHQTSAVAPARGIQSGHSAGYNSPVED